MVGGEAITAGHEAGDFPPCRVLVVDDDPDCREEYCEIVDSLGYERAVASGAREALRLIAEDPSIGIVLTDIKMPNMDGISLLDELSARFAPVRPIVAVVITGYGSLDAAVQAMRSNAVDFLTKPVSREGLVAALRRAANRRALLLGQSRLAALQQAAAARSGGAAPGGGAERGPGERLPREELIPMVRSIIRNRARRADFLNPELFADPSWDILLELTAAKLEGTPVPVSSACVATQVPFTTAYRYVQQLVASGLVRRWKDQHDQRRVLLELEPGTFDAMVGYLSATTSRVRRN